MLTRLFLMTFISQIVSVKKDVLPSKGGSMLQVFDLTKATVWKEMSEYYLAVEKQWKICVNCGVPGLGTVIHVEQDYSDVTSPLLPAVLPPDTLLTRLVVIDVKLSKLSPKLALSLDVAFQWPALKKDPLEPTLLLFKFGWKQNSNTRACVCDDTPGLSYKLAEWIAGNLTHVIGVATDAPTLESEETREYTTRTVSNVLGKSGIYLIENVDVRKGIPVEGCITIAMPLKLLHRTFVPVRLLAYCPPADVFDDVVMTTRSSTHTNRDTVIGRNDHIDWDEIINLYELN